MSHDKLNALYLTENNCDGHWFMSSQRSRPTESGGPLTKPKHGHQGAHIVQQTHGRSLPPGVMSTSNSHNHARLPRHYVIQQRDKVQESDTNHTP
jgi:hypothetical protein